ncbi:hypothetical protein KUCAC02_015334, partial [Chaenocephalus aceratus]
MEKSSPRMTGGTREAPVNSSPAVASNAEGEEIEVLESTDVLPVAQEDQWKSLFDKDRKRIRKAENGTPPHAIKKAAELC